MSNFPLEQTDYGFTWGPVVVERVISHPKWGVILSIKTSGEIVELRATPGGSLKIHKWREV